jgi:hypothetical protein
MELGSGFRPEGGHEADYDDPDRLSDEIYKAKVAVETALRPHLEAPTLEQFLLLTELRASVRGGDCFPRIAGPSTVHLVLKARRISDHMENEWVESRAATFGLSLTASRKGRSVVVSGSRTGR